MLLFDISAAILTGIGAMAAGVGSFLSGLAALKLARARTKEGAQGENP